MPVSARIGKFGLGLVIGIVVGKTLGLKEALCCMTRGLALLGVHPPPPALGVTLGPIGGLRGLAIDPLTVLGEEEVDLR